MTTDYERFLEGKLVTAPAVGFETPDSAFNPQLFDWQRRISQWGCRRGWAAIWAGCGLGKSLMQLSWCQQVFNQVRKPVLLLAPLGVTFQLQQEAEKFGIPVQRVSTGREKPAEINVTSYHRLGLFNPDDYCALDLDEASILKGFSGKYRRELTDFAAQVDYRLSATATPAPNDIAELTTQAEFLGVMSAKEVAGEFFRTEQTTSTRLVLKPHAKEAFYNWLASWAVALRQPSDLGYPNAGFDLPALHHHEHIIEAPLPQQTLIQAEARGIKEQRKVRQGTLKRRVEAAVEIALAYPDEPVLLWCDLNAESEMLHRLLPGSCEVKGNDKPEDKERGLLGFTDGTHRVFISKPSICGHGMNWQHCARMAFVGLSNSYEQIYQAKRRCWRFGQQREVHCHLVISDADGPVTRNIQRKEDQAAAMLDELVSRMGDLSCVSARRDLIEYRPQKRMTVPQWLVSAA